MEMPLTPSPFTTPFVSSTAHPSPSSRPFNSSHSGKYATHRFPTSLSIFPLEIWLNIFDLACTDDGTTSLSLSRTSRAFRELSRFHRYRSVVLEGWESVLKFEDVYCSSSNLNNTVRGDVGTINMDVGEKAKGKMRMKDEEEPVTGNMDEEDYLRGCNPISGIVNLYVHIPELYNAAYPPETWLPDVDSDEDTSYSPENSDDEGDGGRDEHEHDTSMEENAVTGPTDLGRSAQNDGDQDETSSTTTSSSNDWSAAEDPSPSRPREPRPMHGQNLSHLLDDPFNLLAVFEHKVYSALRRILLLSSSSLQVFALSFQPVSSFHLEAVIPRLEKLKWFSVFKDTMEDTSRSDIPRTLLSFRLKLTRIDELSKARGCLWPNLECLNVNSRDNHFDMISLRSRARRAWNDDAFDGLLAGANKLKVLYAPRYMVRPLSPFPQTVNSVHAYLGHPDTYSRVSVPINSFTPTSLGPLPAGTVSLSIPVFYPGQSTNANASSTNNSNADTEDTTTEKSKRVDSDKQLALTEGEITFLLYRGVTQPVLQQVRSPSAVYYRVPEPGEIDSTTPTGKNGAEDEGDANQSGDGKGDGKGGETETETEKEQDSGKGVADGEAMSTNEPVWVKEGWLKAVEHGW